MAIDYLVQILNAFKTLVDNNIMHRDFKLANILLHDGTIKIADFGFAKILGNEQLTTTMLGSPLNMAPEVLAGKEYNNKADIWSIGTCLYEVRIIQSRISISFFCWLVIFGFESYGNFVVGGVLGFGFLRWINEI